MDLNQVTLSSSDVAAAVSFYELLGLRVIVDSRPRYVRFEFPLGNATLSLHEAADVVPSGVVLYFECADLDQRCAALVAAGVKFDQPPTDRPWLWREARLRDPDGHELCLYGAGENRRHPPWRVG